MRVETIQSIAGGPPLQRLIERAERERAEFIAEHLPGEVSLGWFLEMEADLQDRLDRELIEGQPPHTPSSDRSPITCRLLGHYMTAYGRDASPGEQCWRCGWRQAGQR